MQLNPTVALQATANTLADRLDGNTCDAGTLWHGIAAWAAAEPGYPAGRAASQINAINRPAAATLRDLAKRLAQAEAENATLRHALDMEREANATLRSDNATLRDELALARGLNATLRGHNDRQAATIMSKREENDCLIAELAEERATCDSLQTRIGALERAPTTNFATLERQLAAARTVATNNANLADYYHKLCDERAAELVTQGARIAKLVKCNDNQAETIIRYQSKDREQAREIDTQDAAIRTKDATIRKYARRLENQGRSIRAYQRENADINERLRDALPTPKSGEVPALHAEVAKLTASLAASNARADRLRTALGKIDTSANGAPGYAIDWHMVAIRRRSIAAAAISADNT